MEDCNTCQRIRNGTCAGLTCEGYLPVPYIDPDILRNAQERHDNSRWGNSKYASSKVAKAEARIKEKAQESRFIEQGRKLYYCHKRTGELCSGVVTEVHLNTFAFRYGTQTTTLEYSAINTRLFYTPDEAKRHSESITKA